MSKQYALILAGGSGTRFWPLSRNAKPKQLLNLFGDTTLLGQTIDRLKGLIPVENIFILTNELQEQGVRECAPELPAENIFAEPAKRDTAPAVALGIGLIAARDPEATMMVLPADQLIQDTASYHQVMADALTVAASSESLLTIGIKPTWPCPSYGYIERGDALQLDMPELKNQVYQVSRFREKPNPELAQQFLDQGNFSWNAGMFIWSIASVTKELAQHTPELAKFIEDIAAADDTKAFVKENFPELTPISIDYALMEKAKTVLNIEATFDWDDVGSWISVAKYLDEQGDNNKTNTELAEIDSQNNIVFNARPGTKVALLGCDDLIVVQTDDALLVCNRHQADAIKNLGGQLPAELL
ncbi:mannose-1-phosphate guanylyltransferase [Persicirhabdus sediminis]|uniref:mannose-1-phosphate guanylyltransferase n=1 Tax=Persicirhabdus sediminis TaxID=454144 RepID=A0A8J7MD41_9BACT|nr:mannose-1-phosphate guanylyltransferase [Persicirhabdus sediminis]MBK1790381.1 NTP transferase domain-containing protein [Persicirhabdus sediminis]